MSLVQVRPTECYAWHGQSLLITNTRGDCDATLPLSGFYFREARFLRTIRFEVNGRLPWLCECAAIDPTSLEFLYVHPELAEFGGGGSGQSQDRISVDERGVPHRAIDIRLRYAVRLASLQVTAVLANRSPRQVVELDVAWRVDADFADVQEALAERRQQSAAVHATPAPVQLELAYGHPHLPYRTVIGASGCPEWTITTDALTTHLRLGPQSTVTLTLAVSPRDCVDDVSDDDARDRERVWANWRRWKSRRSCRPEGRSDGSSSTGCGGATGRDG
jgi:hypothetical protein